jgi:hypothetical protein
VCFLRNDIILWGLVVDLAQECDSMGVSLTVGLTLSGSRLESMTL